MSSFASAETTYPNKVYYGLIITEQFPKIGLPKNLNGTCFLLTFYFNSTNPNKNLARYAVIVIG